MTTVIPQRIVFTRPVCDYCFKEDKWLVHALNDLHGIKVCEEHFVDGQRDVKAWFHTNDMVLIEDLLKVYDLPRVGILVPRSNGSFTEGGELVCSSVKNQFVHKNSNGDWVVMVSFLGLQKEINIKILCGDAYGVVEHLERGFYKDEYDSVKDLTVSTSTFKHDGLQEVYVPGTGVVRMLIMPPPPSTKN